MNLWLNDAMADLYRQLLLMINFFFFTAINPKHFLGAPIYQCFDSISNDVNLTKSNVARFVKRAAGRTYSQMAAQDLA